MTYWPWWLSGLALSAVMVVHWFTLKRMMAVSGRITGLVDRLRFGPQQPTVQMTPQEMMAAIQAATMEEFGAEDETLETPIVSSDGAPSPPAGPAPRVISQHLLFLVGLVLGGLLSVVLAGDLRPTVGLHSEGLTALFSGHPSLMWVALGGGGILVGFGTRMAGGCTSGHGLCGTSRFQPGSLLATVCFFGAGIVTSFVLGALS